ncbi:hypothetical protein P3S67_014039 [Capsicum chacoense]
MKHSKLLWTESKIQLQFFDPSSSSTARLISCSDQRCAFGAQYSDTNCSATNQCEYTLQYDDGSETSGYYIADDMQYDIVAGNSSSTNSSARVICSTSQTGGLAMLDSATDGIFGLGQYGVSVIAQPKESSRMFSHIAEEAMVEVAFWCLVKLWSRLWFTLHLSLHMPQYMVNLESIAVNGQSLAISPQVFKTTGDRGTMIDSGTTLGYLAEEAYDIFVNAISFIIRLILVNDIFPMVSLNFPGGAAMILRAEDYLIWKYSLTLFERTRLLFMIWLDNGLDGPVTIVLRPSRFQLPRATPVLPALVFGTY